MRILIALLLLTPAAFGQLGFKTLTGTTLQTVAPQNCTGSGPAYCTGVTYPFSTQAHQVIDSWGGAAADTTNNLLYVWGGGHVDYAGNEVYKIDIAGSTASRVVGPSNITGATLELNTDGTPTSRHTYQGLVWLPQAGKMFVFGGSPYPSGGLSTHTWLWDPASTGTRSGWTEVAAPITGPAAGPMCVLDTVYDTATEGVLCYQIASDTAYWRYNVAGNTWTKILSVTGAPDNATFVVDPWRKKSYIIGNNFNGGLASGVWESNWATGTPTYPAQITATSCSPLYSVQNPGLVYDSYIHRVVGYPGNGNTVYIFDSDTATCIPQTFTGGAVSSPSVGEFSRFAYFPKLNKYLIVSSFTGDAITFQLEPAGIGTATAADPTCLDKDGDTYGVGCAAGTDADDNDSTVHTADQACTKWGGGTCTNARMKTFLAGAKGYAPAHICYVSTAGNDGTAAWDNPATPWATPATAISACGAGNLVMFRGGTFSGVPVLTPPSGSSSSAPTIMMGYPGETPALSNSGSSIFDIIDKADLVIDGLKISGAANCINGGTDGVAGTATVVAQRRVTVRNMELSGCGLQGMMFPGYYDLTIEDNYVHDLTLGAQHCFYIQGGASDALLPSKGLLLMRNTCRNYRYNGVHMNTQTIRGVISRNIVYNDSATDQISGISLQNGTSDSIVEGNLIWNAPNSGIDLTLYDTLECGLYGLGTAGAWHNCPYAENRNLIQGNTVYQATGSNNGGIVLCNYIAGHCYDPIYSSGGIPTGLLDSNTFVNNIVVGQSGATAGGYEAVQFTNPTVTSYLSSSTWKNNLLYNTSGPTYVWGYQPGSSFGYAGYTTTGILSLGAPPTATGTVNANPQFVSAPSNLHIQSASAAKYAGVRIPDMTPRLDITGYAYADTPSIGAYEFQGTVCSISPTTAGPYTAGESVSRTFTTSNCSSSAWSATGLTGSGLSVNSSTGALTGTAVAGTYPAHILYDTADQPVTIVVGASSSAADLFPLPSPVKR